MTPILGDCKLCLGKLSIQLHSNMLIPMLIQPASVLLMQPYSRDSIVIVGSLIAAIVAVFMGFSRREPRYQIYYYWIVSSVTYVMIMYETTVVPLSEIESDENFVLVLFAALAILFLYLTKTISEDWVRRPHVQDVTIKKNYCGSDNSKTFDTCHICWLKVTPRSYHCRICQTCVPRYEYHCYWLNSCIGENNQPFFVVGLVFSMLSLGYASLLILTTICQPEFIFGLLMPQDCRGVASSTGMFTCFVCGIYCMELAVLVLAQLIHQVWLISRGYSALEWKEEYKYRLIGSSPHSRGLLENWIQFFKNMNKISRSTIRKDSKDFAKVSAAGIINGQRMPGTR